MTSRKNCTQNFTNPERRKEEQTPHTREPRKRFKRISNRYPMPTIVACEVEGEAGYWRAIHSNGLVQTVKGTRAEAVQRVQAVVDRLNAFEAWCHTHPKKQRIALL